MKKCVLYFVLFAGVFTASAQNDIYQIYKNWQDYKSGLPAYTLNCHSSKEKIKLHHVFAKNYIDIIKDGVKKRLYKDSIFGYADCKQITYRFYKSYDEEYRILENKGIVIYLSYVKVSPYNAKSIRLAPAYFFSAGLNTPVYPLTVLNLKKAFPDNVKFHDMLDVAFGDGTPVYSYDAEHKMYSINFLLNNSSTNP